jgi:hypothetical protein
LGLQRQLVTGLAAAFTLLFAADASAATITVTGTADDVGMNSCNTTAGTCGSLRDAIEFATSGDTISLPAGTYTLNNGELAFSRAGVTLTIAGAGATPAATTIHQAGGGARVIDITAATENVTLQNVKVTGGGAPSPSYQGGGIYNTGSLTLTGSLITGNAASVPTGIGNPNPPNAQGGGIYNTGTLSLSGSTLSSNAANGGSGATGNVYSSPGQGGGIYNTGGTVTLDGNSTVTGNGADGGTPAPALGFGSGFAGSFGYGGGIFSATGTVTLTGGSSVNGNTAAGGAGSGGFSLGGAGGSGQGGGIYNSAGTLTVSGGATISGNQARGGFGGGPDGTGGTGGSGFGGGVWSAGPVTLTGSTVSGNSATGVSSGVYTVGTSSVSFSGVSSVGGGIDATGGTLTVDSSTISGNTAGVNGTGGGLATSATLSVVNSTIAGNTSGDFAIGGGGASGDGPSAGGGIAVTSSGHATFVSATIAANTAESGQDVVGNPSGANIFTAGNGAVTARQTIVAEASSGGHGAVQNCASSGGTVASSGYNLEDDLAQSCSFFAAKHDVVGPVADLNPLAPSGGATQTMSLQSTSAAIDAGPPGGCTNAANQPLTVDQRGIGRGVPCDIGAYETSSPPVNSTPPSVTGTAASAAILICAPGSWSGDTPQTDSYQWERDGTAIGGATNATYSPQTGDAGHGLDCAVTASNDDGQASPSRSQTVTPLSLTQPTSGSSSTNAKPTFAGVAGTTTGDAGSATVTLYSGPNPSGATIATLTTLVSQPGGAYTVTDSTALVAGTYTAVASQSQAGGVTGASAPVTFLVTKSATPPQPPKCTATAKSVPGSAKVDVRVRCDQAERVTLSGTAKGPRPRKHAKTHKPQKVGPVTANAFAGTSVTLVLSIGGTPGSALRKAKTIKLQLTLTAHSPTTGLSSRQPLTFSVKGAAKRKRR